ncbi:MAG: hypothetical protein ABH867_02215 [Patescibacteria group bacterium]|nr:hypothetical protein [Patescibacteria group bacterium]
MSKQANKKQAPVPRLGFNPLVDNVMRQMVGQSQIPKVDQKDLVEKLVESLKEQGIKSVTYRFPMQEISSFDLAILDLQKALKGKRVNKNDVIRTSVNILLEDWKKNKKESLIFKIMENWINREG